MFVVYWYDYFEKRFTVKPLWPSPNLARNPPDLRTGASTSAWLVPGTLNAD
jgi:hypothetical protein